MKDKLIDFEKFYINQGDPDFADIQFKNRTTVKSGGCAVCCAAMIICKSLNLTSAADKQAVIKKVIADTTNDGGLVTWADIKYNGRTFRFVKNVDYWGMLWENEPSICKLNGHFVLVNGFDMNKMGYDMLLIKDPGARLNSNLQQPMQRYGSPFLDMISLKAV